jgi:hypothetical protein
VGEAEPQIRKALGPKQQLADDQQGPALSEVVSGDHTAAGAMRRRAMRRVMVSYRVKPDRVAENEELVRAVYEELAATEPPGLRYGTFKREDGVSFVHIAETDAGENPLSRVAAFGRFQAGVAERCDEPPSVVELTEIGSYHFLGDVLR